MILLGAAQVSLSPYLQWQTVHPNFLLVAVVAWSMLAPFPKAIGWAFLAGLLLDFFSTAPFGVFTAAMLGAATAANFWFDRFAPSAVLLPVALILPYSIGFDVVSLLLQQLLGRPVLWSGTLLRLIVSAGLLNLVVMMLLYPLFQWMERASHRDEIML